MTSFRTRFVAAMLLCVATSGIACESASSSFGSSSGGFPQAMPPGPAPITSGTPPPSPPGLEDPCPGYDPPAVGSDCSAASGDDVRCEYGHDLDGDCNDSFACTGGRWEMDLRPGCFGRCPSSFADIVPGAPCADGTVGCSYLEGTCACIADPDAADAGSGDAGPEAGAPNPVPGTWRCAPPPGSGCPPQRPSVGSNCVHAMTCDYGACALGRDVVYACDPNARRWLQADYPDCN